MVVPSPDNKQEHSVDWEQRQVPVLDRPCQVEINLHKTEGSKGLALHLVVVHNQNKEVKALVVLLVRRAPLHFKAQQDLHLSEHHQVHSHNKLQVLANRIQDKVHLLSAANNHQTVHSVVVVNHQ